MGQTASAYIEDLGFTAGERAVMEFPVRKTSIIVLEIARAYDVSRQHIQTSVNLLLEKKLAVLEENPSDKRSPNVASSNRGSRFFAEIANRDGELLESVFAKISKSDQKTTRQTLESMWKNLSTGACS